MYRWGVVHFLTGSAAEVINPLRECYDPRSARAVRAHITLAGPFNSPLPAVDYSDSIAAVANRFKALKISFDRFESFMPVSCTNYAKPNERESITALHDALVEKWPWKEPFEYCPHATITEFLDTGETVRVQKILAEIDLKEIDQITKLSLVQKDADGIWKIVQEFPLVPISSDLEL